MGCQILCQTAFGLAIYLMHLYRSMPKPLLVFAWTHLLGMESLVGESFDENLPLDMHRPLE
jgi:hypothetical protein